MVRALEFSLDAMVGEQGLHVQGDLRNLPEVVRARAAFNLIPCHQRQGRHGEEPVNIQERIHQVMLRNLLEIGQEDFDAAHGVDSEWLAGTDPDDQGEDDGEYDYGPQFGEEEDD